MEYKYKTHNTCARYVRVVLEGDVVQEVQFLEGGCPGNLQALPILVKGMTVSEIEQKLGGVRCGIKGTSCAAEMAKAVRAAYEASQK